METDGQTHSLFHESSSVALQASTDLKRLKVVTMVRRRAAQEHPAALAQLASRISAIMKFGAGADDDSFVKNCGGGFDQLTVDSKTFTMMPLTVSDSTSGSVWTRTLFRLSCSACALK